MAAPGHVDIGLTRLKKLSRGRAQCGYAPKFGMHSRPVFGYETAGQPDVALVYLHELLAMNREAKAAQVLVHHTEYVKRVERPYSAGSIRRRDGHPARQAAGRARRAS